MRVLAAYVAYRANRVTLLIMAALASAAVLGWLLIISGVWRRTEGVETCGKRIWWVEVRPIHMLIYSAFVYFAIKGDNKTASLCLGLDVIVACVVFLHHLS